MTDAWDSLTAALDRWADAGQTTTLWWRDDDAAAPCPALFDLARTAHSAGVPIALAVIPARATPDLAGVLADWPGAAVIQHGLSHTNHENPPAKKAELGSARPTAAVLADLAEGWRRLAPFDPLPVLVPPWNRIAPDLITHLPTAGYAGLSTFAPRTSPHPAAGLVQVNTHMDIMNWRGGGGFAGIEAAIAAAVRHLTLRRTGTADPSEPTGLLTHHLVHDAECWRFLDQFLTITKAHPAVRWLDASAIFGTRT
jgi:hypothetical protein